MSRHHKLGSLILIAIALSAGTVHAGDDDPIRWTGQTVYTTAPAGRVAAGQTDPISGTFRLNAEYWECAPPNPANCWRVSRLSFWATVDLGYRHHRVVGRSAITYGTMPWRAWTGKRQAMVCAQSPGFLCGPWMTVPHTHNAWSKPRWYTAFRLMSKDWFRFQASACVAGFCGPGFNRSVTVYCSSRAQQCYFDV